METNPKYHREAQTFIYLQWIALNAFGWALGLLMTFQADGDQPGLILTLRSLPLGLMQWMVLRRYLRSPSIAWIGATVLGFGLGVFLAQQVAQFLVANAPVNLTSIGGGIVLGGIIGVLLGLAMSSAQALLLPNRYPSPRYWILANVIGWGLGFQLSSVMLYVPEQITSLTTTIFSAAVTGLWLTQLLNSEK